MIIERVSLENFISHSKTDILLGPGIIAFVGPNGAGKTSVLDGIHYALFGRPCRGNLIDLVKKGASRARVEVEFSVGGDRYIARREIVVERKGKASCREAILFKVENGKRIPYVRDPKQVTKAIEEIIESSEKVFSTAVFVKQGEIDKILRMPPAERKKLIDKLIGLDKYEKAYQLMKDAVISHFEEKLRELEGKIETLERLEEKLEELRRKLREAEKVREEVRAEVEEYRGKLADLESKLKTLEAKREEYNRLRPLLEAEIGKMRSLEDSARRIREELKRIVEAKMRAAELVKEAEKLPLLEEAERLSGKIDLLEARLKPLRRELEELEYYERVVGELEDKAKKYEEATVLLEEKRAIVERLRGETSALDNIRGEIEEIEEKIRRKEEEIEEALIEFSKRLKVRISSSSEALSIIRERLSKLREDYKKIEKELHVLNTRIGELNSALRIHRENVSMLQSAKGTCPLCKQPLREEDRLKHLRREEEIVKKLVVETLKAKAKLRDLEARRIQLDKTIKRIEALNPTQISVLEGELGELRESWRKLLDEKNRLDAKIAELREAETENMELEKILDELRGEWEAYSFAKKMLSQMRKRELVEEEIKPIEEELKKAVERLGEILGKLGISRDSIGKQLDEARSKSIELEKLKAEILREDSVRRDLERLEKEISKSKENIEEYKSKIEKLSYDEALHEELKKIVEDIRGKLGEKERELAAVEGEIRIYESSIEDVEREIRELKPSVKEGEKVRSFLSFLKTIREKVYHRTGLPQTLRRKVIPLLERKSRQLLETFNLPINDVKLVEDGEKFEIIAVSPEGERGVDSLSGGERIALALAIRMAVAFTIMGGKLDTMMLDEPTIHLDEERKRDFINIIRSSFTSHSRPLPQLLIITHDRELIEESGAVDVIYSFKRSSLGTVVEQLIGVVEQ